MHKVFLKPTSQEIIIKGNSKEGHTDVFAYDYYDDENRRKLGGLYIVGNVKQDDSTSDVENNQDIAYVVNLVASLAKREYYLRPDISPRDAFAATLKKINNVIEEFFKNKTLKVNIGIFAVAGEEIIISKLGKFKIILCRLDHVGGDSRTIDILNNVDLFNKERVEEKEFSNIISGKISAGDKLFAFYPNRMINAREKSIKADLLKFDGEQFLKKINLIKETKPDFDCGALYLSLNNHKEPTVVKKPVTLLEKMGPSANLAKAKHSAPNTNLSIENETTDTEKIILTANQSQHQDNQSQDKEAELPRIISSEFSLGRKVNPLLASILTATKVARRLFSRNVNLKRKFIVLFFVTGIMMISVMTIKTFVVINPEQRQLNTIINQARTNLKLVQTKINQNDFIGARQTLVESLSSIYAVGIKNDTTQKTTEEIYGVLDNIDKAIEISPSPLESIPEELTGKIAILKTYKDRGIALDIYQNNLYILTDDNILKLADVDKSADKEPVAWLKTGNLPPQSLMIAADGSIYVMNGSGTLAVYYKGEKVSENNTFIVSREGDVLMTSKDSDKLYLVNKNLARIYELDKESKNLIRTIKVGSSEPFIDAFILGNSTIIITTKDGRVWKIN